MKDGSRRNLRWGRLGVPLVLLAILPTVAVGWMAHNYMDEYVRSDRMEDVGQIADIKHDQLVWALRRAHGRAKNFLSRLSEQCPRHGARLDRACAARLIGAYLATEGAQGATLRIAGSAGAAELTVGASAVRDEDSWKFAAGQLGKFSGAGPGHNQSYLVVVTGHESGLDLALTFPSSSLQSVFEHQSLLGASGETFLVDAEGYFITRPRHESAQGRKQPILTRAIQTCLAGHDSETADVDYRGLEAIQGLRHVPELGTACIAADVSQAEAYASLVALEKAALWVFGAFLLPVVLVALYVAGRIAKAEDLRRESAERLQSHIDNSPMAFVAWDRRYRVTQWSREAERIFGWSAGEVLGRPLAELRMVYAADIPLVEQTMAKLAESNARCVVADNRNVTKDGRIIDCVWYNTVVPGRNGNAWIMSQVLDVTEQKRAERELKESEQRFRILATATYEGVAITAQGKVVDANEQLTRMLGYERDELIGMPVADIIAPEDRERVLAGILAGQPSHLQHGAVCKDGARITVEARGHNVSQDGGVSFRLTAIRDVSARVKADSELRAAKADAERANAAKSRFLAAASHDLRQPLAALNLYVSVLKSKLPPTDQELLVNVRECVGGLGKLLSTLLDLSKLDAGVVTPQVRNFALDDVLHKVLAAHAPEAESKGLRLRARSVSQTVRTDAVLYQRIIGNLVANAIRYTRQGGVLIGCRRRGGKIWVEVWDTGIGIPHDKIGEIFEEFKQLGDDARTYGSGLGLTIVAKTATLLNLQIRVRSHPGHGSMFAIELPPGKRLHHTKSMPPMPLDRGMRIAVVDDNPIVLNALVCGLENAGHQVVAAASGDGLRTRLGDHPPEIMVCDYRLAAGETGFDVVSSVRAVFGDEVPAVIITGDTDPKLMRSMTRKGITILHKPVDIDDLQQCIAEAMERPTVGVD